MQEAIEDIKAAAEKNSLLKELTDAAEEFAKTQADEDAARHLRQVDGMDSCDGGEMGIHSHGDIDSVS